MICQDMTINAINSYYLVLCQSDKNPVGNCQYTCLGLVGKERPHTTTCLERITAYWKNKFILINIPLKSILLLLKHVPTD